MALFNPYMKFDFLGAECHFWSAKKVPFYVSGSVQVLIQVNKWDYLKNPSQESKNIFA